MCRPVMRLSGPPDVSVKPMRDIRGRLIAYTETQSHRHCEVADKSRSYAVVTLSRILRILLGFDGEIARWRAVRPYCGDNALLHIIVLR